MKKNGCNSFPKEGVSLLNSSEKATVLVTLMKAVYPFRRSLSFCANVVSPLASLFPSISKTLSEIEDTLENEESYSELIRRIEGD